VCRVVVVVCEGFYWLGCYLFGCEACGCVGECYYCV